MRIVVVGAGILGASTAYHLAAAGADVTVVDQAHDGRATAAGAGIICPWVSDTGDAGFHELYVGGARYYASLVADLADLGESDLGYGRVGGMVVSHDAAKLDFTEDLLRRRQATAPEMGEISRLSPRDASQQFPPLRPDYAGVHVSGGARVDGRRLAAALLRAARHHGASIRQGLVEIIVSRDTVAGVRSDGQTISSDQVVVAAGAWAPSLMRPLGLDVGIEPQRGQIMHLRLPGTDTRGWPVILPTGSHYLLAFDDSRIVIGATREAGTGFDFRVTASGQAEILAQALAIAPGLGVATVIETRVGFRPVGPGIRPMLGRFPGLRGLVFGNGLGAAGLTIGPFAGRLLAHMALEQDTEIDLAPFGPASRQEDGSGHGIGVQNGGWQRPA